MKFGVQNGKPRRAAHSEDLPRAGKYGDTAGKRKCRNIAISRREPPQKANSPTPFNLFAKSNFPLPTEIRRARKSGFAQCELPEPANGIMVMFERELLEREIAGK